MLEEEYQKKYQSLPEKLQKALDDEKLADKVYEVGQRYKLSEEDLNEMAKIAGEVLLGTLAPRNLEKALKERVKINQDQALSLARNLDLEVFLPLKDDLGKIYSPEDLKIKEKIPEKEKPEFEAVIPEKPKEDLEEKLKAMELETLKEMPLEKEKKSYPPRKDPYREPIDEEDLKL